MRGLPYSSQNVLCSASITHLLLVVAQGVGKGQHRRQPIYFCFQAPGLVRVLHGFGTDHLSLRPRRFEGGGGFAEEGANGVVQMAASGQVGDGGSVSSNRDASWGLLANSGDKYNGSTGSYGSALSPGDVVMVAVDFAARKIWWGKNGTWFASGGPAAGTNAAFSNLADWLYPAVSSGSGSKVTANFGASAFAHTPPSGFSAWDT